MIPQEISSISGTLFGEGLKFKFFNSFLLSSAFIYFLHECHDCTSGKPVLNVLAYELKCLIKHFMNRNQNKIDAYKRVIIIIITCNPLIWIEIRSVVTTGMWPPASTRTPSTVGQSVGQRPAVECADFSVGSVDWRPRKGSAQNCWSSRWTA